MTEVEFHTGLADPVAFACRLLRRAARQGVRVQVTAPSERLAQLDHHLWTQDARDFVPHVRMPGAPAAVAARTPIWLAGAALGADAPRVLMNLGAGEPEDVTDLDRVIEIVSSDADAADGGRERWRAYKSRGLSPRQLSDAGTPRS